MERGQQHRSAEDVAARYLRENPSFLEDWLKRHLARSARLRESLLRAADRQDAATATLEEGGAKSDDDGANAAAAAAAAAAEREEVIVAPPKAFLGSNRLSPLPSATEEDYTPLEEAHFR